MSDFELTPTPFDEVANAVRIALDSARSPDERSAAAEALARLSGPRLRALALSPEWQMVLRILDGERDVPDLAGDGPWTEPEEWAIQPPAVPATPATQIELYAQDLRHLVRDDFDRTAPLPPSPPRLEWPASIRVAACAAAVQPADTASVEARSAALASRLNAGSALTEAVDYFGADPDVLQAIWETALAGRLPGGVPFRLARVLHRHLSGNPHLASAFDRLAAEIDGTLAVEMLDFLSVEDVNQLHVALRAAAARMLREMEVVNAEAVASVELFVTVRLLQAAAYGDLLTAWHVGEREPVRATGAYEAANRRNELLFDRAFRGCMRQPPSGDTIDLRSQSALRFLSGVRRTLGSGRPEYLGS